MSFYETEGNNSICKMGKPEQKIEKIPWGLWKGLKITILSTG